MTVRENINTVRWRNAVLESIEFINKNAPNAQVFSRKNDLLFWVLQRVPNEGTILEFGVFEGNSLIKISQILSRKGDSRTVFGFDSFEGLEEDWIGHKWGKGAFSTNGKLPQVPKNCDLKVGWIEKTLPEYIAETNDKVAFVHIDTDTYTPAKFILHTLADRMASGTILLFDDFFGYPGWQFNEYKALCETLQQGTYEFLGFSNNQAAIMIL